MNTNFGGDKFLVETNFGEIICDKVDEYKPFTISSQL